MELNLKCMRSVLLEMEAQGRGSYTPNSFKDSIAQYGYENVEYACAMLINGLYIAGKVVTLKSGAMRITIGSLQYQGHQLLEKIRDDTTWSIILERLDAINNHSIEAVNYTASQVMRERLS